MREAGFRVQGDGSKGGDHGTYRLIRDKCYFPQLSHSSLFTRVSLDPQLCDHSHGGAGIQQVAYLPTGSRAEVRTRTD